jgi:hypothetical protein
LTGSLEEPRCGPAADLHSSEREQIDGMYSLASMDRFRDDRREAAKLRGLLRRAGLNS